MGIRQYICAAVLAASALASAAPAAAAPVPALDNADGRALILIPLTLTKIDDLDFGGIIPASTPGTVTISATTGLRSYGGDVTGVTGDAGNRAYFGGAGSPGQQVIIALSPPVELTSVGGDTIPVLGLTLDGPPIRTIDAVAKTFFVGVGGTLQIGADQPEGEYSAPFWVTAIYQ